MSYSKAKRDNETTKIIDLNDLVDTYSASNFNAELHSRRLLSDFNESDTEKKLRGYADLQVSGHVSLHNEY